MTPNLPLLAAFSVIVLLPACKTTTIRVVSSPAAPNTTAEATAEAQLLLDDIMAADNAGDLERVLAFYTDDAVLLPPTAPEVVGKEAIRTHYVGAFGRFQMTVSATVVEARTSGDWGVVRGTVQGSIAEKPEGAKRDLNDKFVGVIERGPDQVWRFSRLIWSPVAKAE